MLDVDEFFQIVRKIRTDNQNDNSMLRDLDLVVELTLQREKIENLELQIQILQLTKQNVDKKTGVLGEDL